MASAIKNLSTYDENNLPSAVDLSFGIVVSDWNAEITHALYEGCLETLLKHGANEENIRTTQVPGAFELPVGAKILAGSKRFDAIICLGCVIKGETQHDEFINHAVANGLVHLSIASGIPIIFGVLTTFTEEQAQDRAGGIHGNKGIEAASTAIRMAVLRKEIAKPTSKIGY
ncbi:MAG: 6,7-dimethyl-8-ribityllumazine synthase [Saprospiraceae bacterium]|nr:6,7-dimethyl-8-ribityllumazine synthase [Saprospiraceae bacterium]MCF8250761.1 6,7-dimethyl-8-ribityllumazine synthase [Saprospiraceae bacterium]MCF8282173.1 6,7-dimethyl-8-ribityllumazine synthase [Bacteroidales bacterium]MCF8312562.1 6,7-dimethyl-8-ribityllumazine synthase [Saprospiraceae bacterium]MCF8440891.1 6,7-dimethyl-8-ribityllumazine synthase [Saprospiraceae bacterium]